MINAIVAGSTGRVGKLIVKLIEREDGIAFAGGADIETPLYHCIGNGDVVIDFTTAEVAANHAALAAEHGKAMIIGTTGLNDDQRTIVHDAAKKIPIIHAPNMSLGVNVLFNLIETASKALGSEFCIEIEETHHTKKLDRPSGTAVRMLDVAVDARGADRNRDVVTLEEKPTTGKHPFEVTSYRKGDVVGDHVIRFTSPEEVLELHHAAFNRELFARGAVVAAKWIVGKPAGLYDMSDVLGLKNHSQKS